MTNELSSIKRTSNSVTTQLQNLPKTEYRFKALVSLIPFYQYPNLFDFLIFFTLIIFIETKLLKLNHTFK
jgi:hypothetical protein